VASPIAGQGLDYGAAGVAGISDDRFAVIDNDGVDWPFTEPNDGHGEHPPNPTFERLRGFSNYLTLLAGAQLHCFC
jgi:hypothetical protein